MGDDDDNNALLLKAGRSVKRSAQQDPFAAWYWRRQRAQRSMRREKAKELS